MPPKRKSQGAASPYPLPATRTRSTRATKAPVGADGNDHYSEVLPSKPVKRARKPPFPASRPDEDHDDEFGDSGRSGAPKPATIEQHLMDQSRKSKDFIQSFKEQVTKGRDRAHETLSKSKQDLLLSAPCSPSPSSSQKNNDLPDDLYATLASAAQTLTTDDNPLFAQTQQLLRLSRAILQCHGRVERDVRECVAAAGLGSPRALWERDAEGMRRLLVCGREVGEKAIEGWISPAGAGEQQGEWGADSDGNGDGDGDGKEEVDGLAKELFDRRERTAEESWGVMAKRQMVALTGVVRALDPASGSGSE
ncbi:Ribosome assembly protein 3 [Madurella fahalii]|uniref:Ribosome assembly protein 3 n=1 Tax=Madurella fahalii TaxID=1157608 RepID=A0ABQ0G658_9PEZI